METAIHRINMSRKRNKKSKSRSGALENQGQQRPLSIREERMLRRVKQSSRRRRLNILLMGLMFVGLGLYFFWPRAQAPEVSAARLALNPVKGPSDASVVLTEFGDFGCPSCRAWHDAGILEQILIQFEGQVRLEWRDFPIITRQSPKAGEAGQCAFDQGMFWEYHDNLYDQPDATVNLSTSALKEYAAEIGLDTEAFNLCLDSGQHEQTVAVDKELGLQNGFRGTPAFTVNGLTVLGNPDLLVQAITTALASQ